MKTEEFSELKTTYDTFTLAEKDLKARIFQDLEAGVTKAVTETTQDNLRLLTEAKNNGTKASASRDFERNTAQLVELKEWQAVLAEAKKPTGEARKLMASIYGTHDRAPALGEKAYGASPLVMPEETLRELHEAVTNKSYLAKGIAVANAPMAATAQYVVDVWPFLRDKPRLRDLIPTQQTDRPSVVYYRGLAAASAAAAVAEGANKPESSPTWESVTVPMSKLAHYATINDEVLQDYAGWMTVIGGEMIAGLIDCENDQIINGSGVAPNLMGLLATSGIQTQALSNNNIETFAKAITKLRTGPAFCEPDVIIANPTNWEGVELFRVGGSTTTDGPFLVNPLTAPALSLWGVKVVLTNRIAAGTAIVANLKAAAEIFVRQDPVLDVHPGGGGKAEFIANQTLIRAEERIALTVPRPKAVVKLTGLL